MNKDKINLPIFKLLFEDFNLLLQANRYAWGLIALFALVETLLFALSGNLVFCISSSYRATGFCNNSIIIFVILRLLVLLCECMFVRNWTDISLSHEKINLKKIFSPDKRDLRVFGIFLCYGLTLLAAALSFYLLYIRVPNPDWRIEIIYFTAVAWGLLLPVVVMRLSCYLAAAAMKTKLPKLSEVWNKTSGNSGKILGGVAILVFVGLFVLTQLTSFVEQSGEIVSSLQAWSIEYIFNFIKLSGIALLINFCYVQYNLLFRSDENERKN